MKKHLEEARGCSALIVVRLCRCVFYVFFLNPSLKVLIFDVFFCIVIFLGTF